MDSSLCSGIEWSIHFILHLERIGYKDYFPLNEQIVLQNSVSSSHFSLVLVWSVVVALLTINLILSRTEGTENVTVTPAIISVNDLIIPLTLISALLHKPHNVLLNTVCLTTSRLINNVCDTLSTRVNEPYASHDEQCQAQLTKSISSRVVTLAQPQTTISTRSAAMSLVDGVMMKTIYLKILLHICIGKLFYFYQVSISSKTTFVVVKDN